MPAELAARTDQQQGVRVGISAPAELSFALYVLDGWVRHKPAHRLPPWVQPTLSAHPGLHERIVNFWGDGATNEWGEMLLLAERNGTLFDRDIDSFLAGLDEAAAYDGPVPPMLTETPEARQTISTRLRALRDDAGSRARYRALARDTWEALCTEWEGGGRAAAESASAGLRQRIERGESHRAVMPATCLGMRETHAAMIETAAREGHLFITSLYFAGEGQMLYDLDGTVLIGLGLQYEQEGRAPA
ncbi:MAG: hypothetical protein ACR2HN_03810 [Tepidiformaceae bacterium]